MKLNQSHNSYKGRTVFLLRTVQTITGLMMKAATRATIMRSSRTGLTLHCKCRECGSHYTITNVPHSDVMLNDKD